MPRYSSSPSAASPARGRTTSSVLSRTITSRSPGAEAGHRHGQAVAVLAGLLDVVGRIALAPRPRRGAVSSRAGQPVEADGGTEQGSEVEVHRKPPAKQGLIEPPTWAGPVGLAEPPRPHQGAPDSTRIWQAPPPFKGAALHSTIPAEAGFQPLAHPDAGEPLVELGDLAAGVHDALHAGPGRVRLRVDVEPQRVALLAHAGPRLELRSRRS